MEEEKFKTLRKLFNEIAVKCSCVCAINDWDLTPYVKDIITQLSPETMKRYLGSGLSVPEHVEGKRILDIGCGSGSLVFILSKMVGETGSVVGIDLTPNLITEAKKQEEYHRQKWGYDKKNTEFFVKNAEDLSSFEDQSFDIVVSNGVICVVPNKDKVFSEAYRVLKNCGEFYLNDVYASMEVPEEMKQDLRLWETGTLGAQQIDEFHTSAHRAGFTTPHLTCVAPVKVGDFYKDKLPGRQYCTAGHRMFRLDDARKTGPVSLVYKGSVKGQESEFKWDINLSFKTGQPVTVDGDLATILTNTRYSDLFDIAETTGSPSSKRAQNPFSYLDQLASQGTVVPHIYSVNHKS